MFIRSCTRNTCDFWPEKKIVIGTFLAKKSSELFFFPWYYNLEIKTIKKKTPYKIRKKYIFQRIRINERRKSVQNTWWIIRIELCKKRFKTVLEYNKCSKYFYGNTLKTDTLRLWPIYIIIRNPVKLSCEEPMRCISCKSLLGLLSGSSLNRSGVIAALVDGHDNIIKLQYMYTYYTVIRTTLNARRI